MPVKYKLQGTGKHDYTASIEWDVREAYVCRKCGELNTEYMTWPMSSILSRRTPQDAADRIYEKSEDAFAPVAQSINEYTGCDGINDGKQINADVLRMHEDKLGNGVCGKCGDRQPRGKAAHGGRLTEGQKKLSTIAMVMSPICMAVFVILQYRALGLGFLLCGLWAGEMWKKAWGRHRLHIVWKCVMGIGCLGLRYNLLMIPSNMSVPGLQAWIMILGPVMLAVLFLLCLLVQIPLSRADSVTWRSAQAMIKDGQINLLPMLTPGIDRISGPGATGCDGINDGKQINADVLRRYEDKLGNGVCGKCGDLQPWGKAAHAGQLTDKQKTLSTIAMVMSPICMVAFAILHCALGLGFLLCGLWAGELWKKAWDKRRLHTVWICVMCFGCLGLWYNQLMVSQNMSVPGLQAWVMILGPVMLAVLFLLCLLVQIPLSRADSVAWRATQAMIEDGQINRLPMLTLGIDRIPGSGARQDALHGWEKHFRIVVKGHTRHYT